MGATFRQTATQGVHCTKLTGINLYQFLLNTILERYLFILNPPEDVFSLHTGNTSITDHEGCLEREQQNNLTHSKGNPWVTVAENIIGGNKPADQVAGLSYPSVFSFHSGKERAV